MLRIKEVGSNIIFHLSNNCVSYIIEVIDGHFVVKRYLGIKIPYFKGSNELDKGHHAFSVYSGNDEFSATNLPLEYSFSQNGDYRITGCSILNKKRMPLLFPNYIGFNQDKNIPTLPHIRASQGTFLNLIFEDQNTHLRITLHYCLLDNSPSIVRWVSFNNKGKSIVHLCKAASLELNLSNSDWSYLTFHGTHANEFVPSFCRINDGIQGIVSTRGASSPQYQPFMALVDKNFNLTSGRFIACHLIWSGDFKFNIEKDQYDSISLIAGINNENFDYILNPDQKFTTPQVLVVFNDGGLANLSKNFQQIYSKYLIQNRITDPLITLNTWEMSYFKVNEEVCLKAIKNAKKVNANLLVVDDGWFVNRNSEKGQLGDWKVDREKFPNGLRKVSDLAHKNKIKFGLWVEPEMGTVSSQLFKKHNDWILGLNKKSPLLLSRNQLVLDLSKLEVQKYLIRILSTLIKENKLDYLKWDFNRQLAPVFSQNINSQRQGEVSYRYVIGLYHILQELRKEFPKLIIENCASGGGRLDPGMLFYTDQTWVSDLTDAVARFRIISNLATLYPLEVFSSHLSKSPNDQDGRLLSLETRLTLSMMGSFGIEMDINSLSEADIQKVKKCVECFKEHFEILHNGYCLPLTPLRKNIEKPISVLLGNQKKNIIWVVYSYGITSAVHVPKYLPLRYLDKGEYKLNGIKYSSEELNCAGITVKPVIGDFKVHTWYLKRI